MARFAYARECPAWGPCDTHHYTDEDTGEYVAVCECGQVDPAMPDPDRYTSRYVSDPNDPNDQPPF